MHEVTQKTFEMAHNRALYFVLVRAGPVMPADLEWLLLGGESNMLAREIARPFCRYRNLYLRNLSVRDAWPGEPFALR